jgi:hypothetical protein
LPRTPKLCRKYIIVLIQKSILPWKKSQPTMLQSLEEKKRYFRNLLLDRQAILGLDRKALPLKKKL